MKKALTIIVLFLVSFFSYFTFFLHEDILLTQGKLANGFRYTIKHNKSPNKKAELRLLVKIGSLEEDDDQRGVAHFVEHMAFNGSTHFKSNGVIKELENMGVHFGNHINASTSYENTTYKLSIPVSNKNLDTAFLVFEDWAGGITFDPKEFEKERGVILEEKRGSNTTRRRDFNILAPFIFEHSKFIDRSPIGDETTLKTVNVKTAKQFYSDWYRPEFMHFVAVGDFDKSKIESLIKKHFSGLISKSDRRRSSRTVQNISGVILITDKNTTDNHLKVISQSNNTHIQTRNDLKSSIINRMVSYLINFKAKEYLSTGDHSLLSMGTSLLRLSDSNQRYFLYASYEDNRHNALMELYSFLFQIEKDGFSRKDIKLLKDRFYNMNWIMFKSSRSITNSLVSSIKEHSVYIDAKQNYLLKSYLTSIINLEDINKRFKEILAVQNNMTIFHDGNEESIDVLAIIDKAETNSIAFKKPKDIPSKLLNITLNLKKITSERLNKKTNAYEYLLENGVKVIFKKMKNTKEFLQQDSTFYLKATSPGGLSLYDGDDLNNAKEMHSIISKSGAGDFSNLEIQRVLSSKTFRTDIYVTKENETIFASGNETDIDSVFQLLYLRLTQPKINKAVFNKHKKALLKRLKQRDTKPYHKFNHELSEFYYQNNPRLNSHTKESLDKLDQNRMLELFKERFNDFNNFTFAIVGDIDENEVKAVIKKYLGNLPTQRKSETYTPRKTNYLKGKQLFIRHYSDENKSEISLTYKSNITYSFKKAFALDAMVSTLKARLRNVIREEKSGTYAVNTLASLSQYASNDSFLSITFSTDPKRADNLMMDVYAEIEKIKVNGVTRGELELYQKHAKVSFQERLTNSKSWLGYIFESNRTNIPLDDYLTLFEKVENTSLEDVKAIAQRIFTDDVLQTGFYPKK